MFTAFNNIKKLGFIIIFDGTHKRETQRSKSGNLPINYLLYYRSVTTMQNINCVLKTHFCIHIISLLYWWGYFVYVTCVLNSMICFARFSQQSSSLLKDEYLLYAFYSICIFYWPGFSCYWGRRRPKSWSGNRSVKLRSDNGS